MQENGILFAVFNEKWVLNKEYSRKMLKAQSKLDYWLNEVLFAEDFTFFSTKHNKPLGV
jgi:hypothetical protein